MNEIRVASDHRPCYELLADLQHLPKSEGSIEFSSLAFAPDCPRSCHACAIMQVSGFMSGVWGPLIAAQGLVTRRAHHPHVLKDLDSYCWYMHVVHEDWHLCPIAIILGDC